MSTQNIDVSDLKYNIDVNDIEIIDPFIGENKTDDQKYSNPFFLDHNGSEQKFTKTNILADEYKYVYILCLCDDFELNESNINRVNLFFEKDSVVSELTSQTNSVTLVQCPFEIIKIASIRSGVVVVNKDVLEYFNHDSVDLLSRELVYLMLQTKESNVRNWIKMYKSDNNLNKFIQQKIFSSYYGINDERFDHEMIKSLGEINDFRFWENPSNCEININEAFRSRRLNINSSSKWNIPESEIEKFLFDFKNVSGSFKSHKYPPGPPDNSSSNTSGQQNTSNTSNTSNTKFKKFKQVFYKIVDANDMLIDKQDVEDLLISNCLSEREKYYLVCLLLSSKNYCHYILNNHKVITSISDIISKYKPIIRYLMGFAWMSLYLEERVKRSKSIESDRFVFDLENASKLPVFPYNPQNPYTNPYFVMTVSSDLLNLSNNVSGVKQSLEYQSGIVDITEFKKRLNLFISGSHEKDILEGANWNNMVITGGSMTAILPRRNPLHALFTKESKADITYEELNRFYQEYYSNSDIDVACNHENIIDFIENVKHIQTIIAKNLGIKDSEIKTDDIKTLAIYINPKLLQSKCSSGEIPYDYDYILKNKDAREIKFYFHELYIEKKKLSNNKNKKILGSRINDNNYFNIIRYCEIEKVTIIINDYSYESDQVDYKIPEQNSGLETVFYLKDNDTIFIKFSETIKYKIHSRHLKHQFEIFRITDKEFFSCIGRFHLPCVRSYYNGTTCYLLPSAITAYMTFTNMDFKYFIGSHDPLNIINKYRLRGYGTILNENELKYYVKYIHVIDKVKKSFNLKDTDNAEKTLGCLDVTNDFFKPKKFIPEEFPLGLESPSYKDNPDITYITEDTISKLYKQNYPKYLADFNQYTTIIPNGNIGPLKRWLIDAAYDLLNN
ncbi:hypothetical protein qu_358 [Acanthamoeba polyphaga mimivirus]|nr:hypothetical protein [Mimivirus reunion]WMV61693.1 hypothetical protein qu_358 [Mimivirus sp.]WMV62670.1 hypothetical protein qu_358 [Acanthamoeba polyphaga mimivirus]WMV63647.1 hypothetical protein qu_358 [Mimivirus sp.]